MTSPTPMTGSPMSELIQRLQNTSVLDQPMEARRLMDACVIALRSCEKDGQHIAGLQKALGYWMPDVFDDRSANDAMFLCGYEGEQEQSWGQQQVDEIARLTAELEAAKRDTDRLDFMLSNDAFTVTCNRDGSILQYQLMTQDEDENYHVLHNERRFYNTERDAIDAAIECADLSASSDGAGRGDQS